MRHLGEGAKISVFSQDLAQVSPLSHHDNSLSFHTILYNIMPLLQPLLTLYACMLTLSASSPGSSLSKTEETTEMVKWLVTLLPACVMSLRGHKCHKEERCTPLRFSLTPLQHSHAACCAVATVPV